MSETINPVNPENERERQMPKFVYIDQLNSQEELMGQLENTPQLTIGNGEAYSLHSLRSNLLSRDEARKAYAINGEIMGVLELPSIDDSEKGTQLAIVDYGKFAASERPPRFAKYDPGNSDGIAPSPLETVSTRYELVRLDAQGSAPLEEDCDNVFGRKAGAASDNLGLSVDNPYVSREHFKVSVRKNDVTIEDSSTNGTILIAKRPAKIIDAYQ